LRTHPPFEELCALSTSGELSREEAEVLRAHLADCHDCRRFLRETREITENMMPSNPSVSPVEVPPGIRERFLARAATEGLPIHAGPPIATPEIQKEQATFLSPSRGREERVATFRLIATQWQAWALVAGACAACFVLGVVTRKPIEAKWQDFFPKRTVTLTPNPVPLNTSSFPDHDQLIALTEQRDQLSQRIAALTGNLDAIKKEKQDTEASLEQKLASTQSDAARDHAALASQAEALNSRTAELQSQLNTLRQQQTLLEADLHTERTRATEYAARLDLAQRAIHTEALAAPATALTSAPTPVQMSSDGEIGSLVAARNLHIIDVYDSTAQGKRQRAFGRVFYVEGRSLVFYAFDLAAPHQAKNITFHLWGERAGQKETTLSLGVLHDDDPAERRWALTFDDPKVLARINSVYVTAESGAKPGDQPRGPKVLYAYFGSQPNHP
jgi:hypothetical protein